MDAGNLSLYAKSLLKSQGFPLIPLHRCEDDFYSFSRALSSAVDYNQHGPYVDKHTPKELSESGATAFLSEDKMAGIAVWPDGNIGAAFKNEKAKYQKAIGVLMLTALSVKGNKLDCYDGVLPLIYAKFGFIPVAKVKFDRRFAPKNWKAEFEEPDVIFWIHCGDSVETVARKINEYKPIPEQYIKNLPCFGEYKEAWDYRDKLIGEKLKNPWRFSGRQR